MPYTELKHEAAQVKICDDFMLGFDFLTLRSAHICTLRRQVPVEAAALRADAAVAEAEQSEKEKKP